jgi:TatA/E family protein of Tat protein translocase
MFADLLGGDTVIIVIVILVLVFGGKAIPKFARNLGSAKSEFEKGIKEAKKGETAPTEGSETKE